MIGARCLPLQDIGDGWWEGELENGETGLFPESYVEVYLPNFSARNVCIMSVFFTVHSTYMAYMYMFVA